MCFLVHTKGCTLNLFITSTYTVSSLNSAVTAQLPYLFVCFTRSRGLSSISAFVPQQSYSLMRKQINYILCMHSVENVVQLYESVSFTRRSGSHRESQQAAWLTTKMTPAVAQFSV